MTKLTTHSLVQTQICVYQTELFRLGIRSPHLVWPVVYGRGVSGAVRFADLRTPGCGRGAGQVEGYGTSKGDGNGDGMDFE